jgi:ribosome-binding protein aMBF1 (putative translation factor)
MSTIIQQTTPAVTTPAPFGLVVGRSRRDLDMSREMLAFNAGMSPGRLRRIETGDECSTEERRELASALHRWLDVRGARVDRLLERAYATA